MFIEELPEKFNLFFDEMQQEFKIKLTKPKIIRCKTRDEFNTLLCKHSTEEWMVAATLNQNVIILENTRGDEEQLIKHEIVHIFFRQKFGTDKPLWLNEGLACYFAGQKKAIKNDVTMDDLVKYFNNSDKDVFSLGYTLVERILGKR